MHTLGKVFLWINLLVLVPAAVLLSAKLINARNYWMQRVDQKEQQVDNNDRQIAEKQKQLGALRAQLVQQRLAWDSMRLANGRADAQGNITVNIGPNQAFANVPQGAPPPIVHVFIPQGQGSMYLGPFQVTAAQGNQSQLQPMFRVVTANPAQDWAPGTTWRLWEMVPSQAPSRVVELTSELVKKAEAVRSRQETLALQQKAVEQAQQHLESRRKELFGNPQAPQIEDAPEVSQGLVAALHDAEAARNAELAQLDRLRREVDQAYERLTQLVAQNEQLVRQLPGGAAPVGLSSAR